MSCIRFCFIDLNSTSNMVEMKESNQPQNENLYLISLSLSSSSLRGICCQNLSVCYHAGRLYVILYSMSCCAITIANNFEHFRKHIQIFFPTICVCNVVFSIPLSLLKFILHTCIVYIFGPLPFTRAHIVHLPRSFVARRVKSSRSHSLHQTASAII